MEVFADTDIGPKRKRNEDRSLVRELDGGGLLAAVADGMGGSAGGGVAAQIAVDTLGVLNISGDTIEKSLVAAITEAGQAITKHAAKTPKLEGMGTTTTAAVVIGSKAYWAHVGDSRLYHLRDDEIRQVSVDHSFLQTFLDDGSMTPEEAANHPFRHFLDQCVGCSECVPDSGVLEVLPGDILLLGTDGLHKVLDDRTIAASLRAEKTIEAGVSRLIATALEGGGTDNITVVAIRI